MALIFILVKSQPKKRSIGTQIRISELETRSDGQGEAI